MYVLSQYSLLRHIALSFGSAWPGHLKLMAIYTGYFDESGHEESSRFVMGGLVLNVDRIAEFETDWLEAIKELPLDKTGQPFLHTVDFISGNEEFAAWKGRYDEKLSILSNAAKVIFKHAVRVFTCVLNVDEYVEMDKAYKMTETFGHPYALLVTAAKEQLNSWADRHRLSRRPVMMIEQRQGYGEVCELFQVDGHDAPIHGNKSIPALQAADYIAYMRFTRIRPTSSFDRIRDSWREVSRALHDDFRVGRDELEGIRLRLSKASGSEVPRRDDKIAVRYHTEKKRRRQWVSRTRPRP